MEIEQAKDVDPTELESKPPDKAEESETTDTVDQPKKDLINETFAPLSDRFAALLIDLTFIGYLLVVGYGQFAERLRLPQIELNQLTDLKHATLLGMAAGVVFIYFFLFEGILARTPGKLLCGLSVNDRYGDPPSLLGVLTRNLFRFVDIALFPLTGLGLAEVTEKHQRLGDLLGGTTVRKSRKSGKALMSLEEVRWGSVTRRSIAIILDLAVFALAALFFLLCLPTSQTQLTHWMLQAGPVLIVVYWILCEILFSGTPAKLLLGLRVVDEHLRPVRIPGSLLRNLFRVLDHNPLGYLCAVLSSRKQRPGDLAAGTTVIRSGWSLRRPVSLIVLSAAIAGLGYYGIHNPDNFVRSERVLKVGPWTLPDLPSQIKYHLGLRLQIHTFSFGNSPTAEGDNEPFYSPGEIIYLTVDVSGFMVQNGAAWIQQDLLVTDPQGDALIDMLNVINRRYAVDGSGHQKMTSSFLLPLRIPTGQYHVKLRIRDRFGQMFGEAEKSFVVK